MHNVLIASCVHVANVPLIRIKALKERDEPKMKPSDLSLSYFNVERIDDVVNDELEIGMTKPMLNVALPAGEVVVGDDDLVALQHELVHQVRADEPGAARDENPPPVLVV